MRARSDILERSMTGRTQIFDELAARVSPETVIQRDELMSRHTTLRVGGPADIFATPATEADLTLILRFCGEHNLPFFTVGRGSNLLVLDAGFRGVVICLAHPDFSRVEVNGVHLRCGAGAKQKTVAVEARRAGLTGVEFLEGIPGSIGGALRMNAGAMGSATFEVVESVRMMDFAGAVVELTPPEMKVEYRGCATLKNHIALGAVFRCTRASREAIEARMKSFSEKRWSSQPATPSAGCMFKNPPACPAGKLIDELGLKGTRVGGAVVSAEHGNFLVNDGGATAKDVLELIAMVKAKVKAASGVDLHTEVEILGA